MLDAFVGVAKRSLLLGRPDEALDHAVLLRAVRRDELLAQAVAPHQCGVLAGREDQPVTPSE